MPCPYAHLRIMHVGSTDILKDENLRLFCPPARGLFFWAFPQTPANGGFLLSYPL